MAGFTELIKNFDKIRDYARDFLVYGYKCRNDYTRKSSRSYDNERRRIESYLTGYIHWETNSRGKNLFISTDSGDLSHNPLFSVWETKSFTTNDCLLHFCLFDILMEQPGITASEATDILYEQYLSACPHVMPDTMTVRNKLNEYVQIGFFQKQKQGKTLQYSLNNSAFNQTLPAILNQLAIPLSFFENITPAGVLGYLCRRDGGQDVTPFSFRHLFTSHTLDDEILIQILGAIQEHKKIQFNTCNGRSQNPFSQTVLPLKIASNVKHGRRYLLAFNNRKHNFFAYRLDYIKDVEVLAAEESSTVQKRGDQLTHHLSSTWGVFLSKNEHMEHLTMTLAIDESTEDYVLTRLKREGKYGTIEKIADNTFVYSINVSNTQEMVPWLRTFIGRILAIKGSNKRVMKEFQQDIHRMIAMYEE